MTMQAQWTRSTKVPLATPQELEAVIETVRRIGRPTVVYLERDGQTLAFGVGCTESVLTWMDRDQTTWHSVGDLARKGTIQLWSCDQLDDFFAELAVPEAVGLDAARSFAATGRRPDQVRWEGDW